jgi:hypothetical protein
MECSGYASLLRATAWQMIERSSGAAPRVRSHAPSVSIGLPAARALLGQTTDPLTPGWEALSACGDVDPLRPQRFDDTFGFTRSVYHPLLLHLYLVAGGHDPSAHERATSPARRAMSIEATSPDHVPLLLWWAVCMADLGDGESASRLVDRTIGPVPAVGVIHDRGPDDLIDAWTFRELVAMHALGRLADLCRRPDWWARVRSAAAFHEGHTQPDYTTYQPWGVQAFITAGATGFAEQQLHDATTHVHVEGGGAGAIPAMILADAAHALGVGVAEDVEPTPTSAR